MPKRINGGMALVVLGAVALIVSLFLHWYEQNRSAWTVFEVWDIVLAGIGIASILAVVPIHRRDVPDEHLVPQRWLPFLAGAVLVIVVVALVNTPPAAQGASLQVGAWLAFGAAVVLATGAIVSRARVSLVITPRAPDEPRPTRAPPEPPDAGIDPDTATQTLPPQG